MMPVSKQERTKKNIEIIPAIDIIGGKCVRLTHGDFSQKKIYNEHPLEVAQQFEDAGLRRLHLVDLDGAKARAVKNWKVLEAIAARTNLVIDFGGGIVSENDLQIVFNSGAALATVGSIAVKDQETFSSWIQKYDAGRFFLGADVKQSGSGYHITVAGWTEETDIDLFDFVEKYMAAGLNQIFCTDVSKDGALQGPSTELYKEVVNRFPDLHFVASGGVSSIDDVYQLQEVGCSGVIIGKAIYEGRIRLTDLKSFV